MAVIFLLLLHGWLALATAWQNDFNFASWCIRCPPRHKIPPCRLSGLSLHEPQNCPGPPESSTEDDEASSKIPTLAAVGGGQHTADTPSSSLLALLRPPLPYRVEQMSSTDLAYIGDAVYELMVRSWAVWPPKRTSDLQTQVVALVRAEHQARILADLRRGSAPVGEDAPDADDDDAAAPFALRRDEIVVLQRGRNAVSGSSRNRRDPSAYQDATALEALVGYLYLTDLARCHELLTWIRRNHLG